MRLCVGGRCLCEALWGGAACARLCGGAVPAFNVIFCVNLVTRKQPLAS